MVRFVAIVEIHRVYQKKQVSYLHPYLSIMATSLHCGEVQLYNYCCRIIPIFCEQGGDKFHIILRDIVPLDIDSCVACFQNCGTVHLKQTNPFTLTGSTPSKLITLMLILPNVCFAPMHMLNYSAR